MKNKGAKHNRRTKRKYHKEIHLSELEHLRVSDKLLREQNGHLRVLCRTQMAKIEELDARCAAESLELIGPEYIKFINSIRPVYYKCECCRDTGNILAFGKVMACPKCSKVKFKATTTEGD